MFLFLVTPLSALAPEQVAPTEKTMQKGLQYLDYVASQEDAIVTYRASDMKLAIHSDASYLLEPKDCSRAGGGHMFMAGTEEIPTNNGAGLNILQIIKAVMSSATEAKLGALFINAKMAVSMCVCSCPPVMGGVTVKHALTSTSSPPNDIPSIPWSPVVLPLRTPTWELARGVSNGPVYLGCRTPWQLLLGNSTT